MALWWNVDTIDLGSIAERRPGSVTGRATTSPRDGNGRHPKLKIWCQQWRAGSGPVGETIISLCGGKYTLRSQKPAPGDRIAMSKSPEGPSKQKINGRLMRPFIPAIKLGSGRHEAGSD